MLKSIWSVLTGEYRTVAGILAGFLKTVETLEAHAEAKVVEAWEHNSIITTAQAALADAEAEAEKALAIAKSCGKQLKHTSEGF